MSWSDWMNFRAKTPVVNKRHRSPLRHTRVLYKPADMGGTDRLTPRVFVGSLRIKYTDATWGQFLKPSRWKWKSLYWRLNIFYLVYEIETKHTAQLNTQIIVCNIHIISNSKVTPSHWGVAHHQDVAGRMAPGDILHDLLRFTWIGNWIKSETRNRKHSPHSSRKQIFKKNSNAICTFTWMANNSTDRYKCQGWNSRGSKDWLKQKQLN